MSKPAPFAQYRGVNYLELVDEVQRRGLYAWQEVLRIGCGPTVDGEHFIDSQIYLCAATAGYIYSDYTPTTVDYRKGSRPVLEKVVDGLRLAGLGDFEKFLWLGRFVRDLPDARGWDLGADAQNGGTEEELIANRVVVCNEQARLMVILSQVAGLPARYVGHHIAGHGVTEVYVDGHWSYFDTRGRFYRKPDGELASTWEVWQDRGIIRRQPEYVRREIHPRYLVPELEEHERVRDPYLVPERNYFNPRECTGIVNYFVADHARFDYRREWPVSPADELRIKELLEQRQQARRELGMVLGH
jgi:transglutaminase-like putative cysteine protease